MFKRTVTAPIPLPYFSANIATFFKSSAVASPAGNTIRRTNCSLSFINKKPSPFNAANSSAVKFTIYQLPPFCTFYSINLYSLYHNKVIFQHIYSLYNRYLYSSQIN